MVHLTEKPVELATRAVTDSSKGRQKVVDPFGGSRSTLIAAEKIERRARLMEIDPPYCDVIVRRWQDCAGRKAVLDGGALKQMESGRKAQELALELGVSEATLYAWKRNG